MALTGLQIYKHLPKTNCGKCGSPTCLAFAMRLAGKKASLDECPEVTEEGKAALGAASRPPIALVTIGSGEKKLEIGNETVLFRHEETFYHPPGVAITVPAEMEGDALNERLRKIKKLEFERVGQKIGVDMVAVKGDSVDGERFAATVKAVVSQIDLPLILMSPRAEVMAKGLEVCADRKPLIYGANKENQAQMVELAKKHGCPLAVLGNGLEELSELSTQISSAGVESLVLDAGRREIAPMLTDLTQIRRQALRKSYRPFGYPSLAITASADPHQAMMEASAAVATYAGIVITDLCESWQLLPILTLRQNIYTDPQKPIQIEAKVYDVGEAGKDSPLLVTTNFSLTYFTVEGDVEASRVPSHILVVDTEGTSVLTAWAADKFNAETIAAAAKKHNVEDVVSHRKIILPGFVAVLSGKLEEELGG